MGGEPEKKGMEALMEALKEAGRLALFALISYLLTGGFELLINSLFGTRLSAEVKMQVISVGTLALRALDKWLHEFGKATENKTLMGGVSRF